MTLPASYLTIARNSRAEITDRHSQFICTLRRVASVDAANTVVDRCRASHPDARHHCFAMVIGARSDERHASDDGEPGGTAGTPMLQALIDADVSDVVAVVTRYFGGVLLGAGSLVRAYRGAVRAALDSAGRVERIREQLVRVALPHGKAGRVEAALRAGGVDVVDADYRDDVILTLATSDHEALMARLAGLTAGAAAPVVTGTRLADRA